MKLSIVVRIIGIMNIVRNMVMVGFFMRMLGIWFCYCCSVVWWCGVGVEFIGVDGFVGVVVVVGGGVVVVGGVMVVFLFLVVCLGGGVGVVLGRCLG